MEAESWRMMRRLRSEWRSNRPKLALITAEAKVSIVADDEARAKKQQAEAAEVALHAAFMAAHSLVDSRQAKKEDPEVQVHAEVARRKQLAKARDESNTKFGAERKVKAEERRRCWFG